MLDANHAVVNQPISEQPADSERPDLEHRSDSQSDSQSGSQSNQFDQSEQFNQFKQSEQSEQPDSQGHTARKHIKITEINYRRNTESDYTEKIEALDRAFNYDSNRDDWWGEPELSLLYGTPLYQ